MPAIDLLIDAIGGQQLERVLDAGQQRRLMCPITPMCAPVALSGSCLTKVCRLPLSHAARKSGDSVFPSRPMIRGTLANSDWTIRSRRSRGGSVSSRTSEISPSALLSPLVTRSCMRDVNCMTFTWFTPHPLPPKPWLASERCTQSRKRFVASPPMSGARCGRLAPSHYLTIFAAGWRRRFPCYRPKARLPELSDTRFPAGVL